MIQGYRGPLTTELEKVEADAALANRELVELERRKGWNLVQRDQPPAKGIFVTAALKEKHTRAADNCDAEMVPIREEIDRLAGRKAEIEAAMAMP